MTTVKLPPHKCVSFFQHKGTKGRQRHKELHLTLKHKQAKLINNILFYLLTIISSPISNKILIDLIESLSYHLNINFIIEDFNMVFNIQETKRLLSNDSLHSSGEDAVETTPREIRINVADLLPQQELLREVTVDHDHGLTYKDISVMNLVDCKADPKIPFTTQGDPVKFTQRQRGILLQVADKIRRGIPFEILGRMEEKAGIPASIMNKKTWDDLMVVGGGYAKPNESLSAAIDRTQSAMGYTYLLGLVSRPTSDLNTIGKRQAFIKHLAFEDRNLLHSLQTELKELGAAEAQTLSFFDGKLQIPGCIQEQYYKYNEWINERLNRSAISLEMSSSLCKIRKLTSTFIQGASIVVFPLYSLSVTGALGQEAEENLDFLTSRFIGQSGPLFAMTSLMDPYTKAVAALSAATSCAMNIKNKTKWMVADFSIDSILQNKLVSVATYYKRMKALYTLMLKYPTLTQSLEHFDKLKAFYEDESLKPLFHALESNTFNGNASFFFRRGNTLVAWSMLQQEETLNKLEVAMTAIGEIDAFVSTASLLENQEEGAQGYCLAEFNTESDTPDIDLEGFWNPMVDPNVVVPNTLKLGRKHGTPNAIITGPNAAGKSTTARAVLASVDLALSLGIIPAKRGKITPFERVITSMNVADDLAQGKSKFQAETTMMKNIREEIKALPKGKFAFVVLDELMTGTSEAEGSAIALASMEDLGNIPNAFSYFITHDGRSPQLEQNTGNFRNFKMSVDHETLRPLYTIEPGVSDQKIAMLVAERVGMDEIVLNRAKEIMNESKK